MACEILLCGRPARLHCCNCRRKVCLEHAVECKDSGEIVCSYCAIASKGLWRRVPPIRVNGSEEQFRTKKRAA